MGSNKVIHKSEERGSADHGWLKSRFSFSFAGWYDPEKMGFGVLRVINDDWVAPSQGFGTHSHNNMEIVSIPLSGELLHKDTLGTVSVIKDGDVQRMSAGSGISHSEYNNSKEEPVSFLQIWVEPNFQNMDPSYDQKSFDKFKRKNNFQLIVSPDGRNDSVCIHQNAYFSLIDLEKGYSKEYIPFDTQNGVYLFLLKGKLKVINSELHTRDAIGITKPDKVSLTATKNANVLIIEVPLTKE